MTEQTNDAKPKSVHDVIMELGKKRKSAALERNRNYVRGKQEAYADAILLLLELQDD